MNLENSEWFEISEKDWQDPRFRGKKVKLLTDAQFPEPVIDEIRRAKIKVERLDERLRNRPDTDVLMLAQKLGRILITLDRDFWDDRKHPLQQVKMGIIYIDEPPDQHECILRAFGLVYGCFAKSYPLDWWNQMKVKGKVGEFMIKWRTWEGKVAKYKMKLRKGYLVAKELSATKY